MTELRERHAAALAALREHWMTCPNGCKPTWSRCATEAALWEAEERAWWAAHAEIMTAPPERRFLVGRSESHSGVWVLIEDDAVRVATAGGGH